MVLLLEWWMFKYKMISTYSCNWAFCSDPWKKTIKSLWWYDAFYDCSLRIDLKATRTWTSAQYLLATDFLQPFYDNFTWKEIVILFGKVSRWCGKWKYSGFGKHLIYSDIEPLSFLKEKRKLLALSTSTVFLFEEMQSNELESCQSHLLFWS